MAGEPDECRDTVPDEIHKILQLGPKFCFQVQKVPVERMITAIEYTISGSNADSGKKEEIDLSIAQHLKDISRPLFFSRYMDKSTFNILTDLAFTRKFLQRNIKAFVLKADTGRATVLMKNEEYKIEAFICIRR